MPNPKNYKNTEEGYKKYMETCMHQTMHMERKKKDRSVAQCLNMWRKEHGSKHPGKEKKAVADLVTSIVQMISAMSELGIDKSLHKTETINKISISVHWGMVSEYTIYITEKGYNISGIDVGTDKIIAEKVYNFALNQAKKDAKLFELIDAVRSYYDKINK